MTTGTARSSVAVSALLKEREEEVSSSFDSTVGIGSSNPQVVEQKVTNVYKKVGNMEDSATDGIWVRRERERMR